MSFQNLTHMHCSTHKQLCQGLCLYPKCQQPQRLLCFECVLAQIHQGHNQAIIDFTSLESLKPDFLVFSQINQSEKTLIQDLSEGLIDKKFEQLRSDILDRLDQTRMQMKSKISIIRQQQRDNEISVKPNQSQTHIIQTVQKMVDSLKNQKISTHTFNNDINVLINQSLTEKVKQSVQFDEELFGVLSKSIFDSISNLERLLVSSYVSLKVEPVQGVQVNNDQILSTQSIQFIGQKQGWVISTKPIQKGIYEIKLRIDKNMNGAVCCGLIPEEFKDKWSIQNCYPNLNLNSKIDGVKFVSRFRGEWQPNGLSPGMVILIEIDLEKGLFRVKDEQCSEQAELQIIRNKYKLFRFYLMDFEGRNNEFTLLKSGKIY